VIGGEKDRMKRILASIGVAMVVLTGMIGSATAWWDSNFDYRVSSTVSNVPTDGYVYNVTLHQGSGTNNATDVFLNNHAQSDYDDVRFILNDTTELSYWLENTSLSTTKAWVKIPDNGTLYIYYGNSTVTSTANGKTTFEFFDDFNDGSINTTIWEHREENGQLTESGGLLDINVTAEMAHVGVSGKTFFDKPVIMECNLSRPGGLDANMRRFWGASNGSINDSDPTEADHFWFYHWGEDEYVSCVASGQNTQVSKSFDNDYHNWKLAWKTDEVKFYIDNELNETITSNVTATQTAPMLYGRSGSNAPSGGTHLYVDWVFVRPYQDPEPTLGTFSSESSETTYDSSNPFSTIVLWSIPSDTAFTVTLAGGETEVVFTASSTTQSLIEPDSQDASSNQPIITITNNGNVNLNFTINLTSAKPSWAVIKVSNQSDHTTATEFDTVRVVINSSVPPGGSTPMYLWTNITSATSDETRTFKIWGEEA